MKRVYLFGIPMLLLGVGCVALARQQSPQSGIDHSMQGPIHGGTAIRLSPDYQRRQVAVDNHLDSLIKQGQAAMQQGQYAQAEGFARQALQVIDTTTSPWLLLARASEEQGKQQQALDAYHHIIYAQGWSDSMRGDPTTGMLYVLALCRSHEWQQAARVFDKAAKATDLYHISPEVHQQAARQLTQEQAQALVRHNMLLPTRINPDNPDRNLMQAAAHYVLGTKHPSYGQPDKQEQIAHLRAAVQLAPRWPQAGEALALATDPRLQQQQEREALASAKARKREDMYRVMDRGAREHMLRYHPNEPQRYHFHDPAMMPTLQERQAAMQALRERQAQQAQQTGQ